jgi:apolipoprotein N-acyltransferase
MSVERLKKVAGPAVFGLLFYLSFSKYDLWFLIFPALLVLFFLRDFWSWFAAGFISLFSSLLWIRIAMVDYGGVSLPVALTLIVLLVLFLTLYQFSLTYLLWRLLGFRSLLLPPLWVLLEILRSHFPYGGFPWLIVGEHIVNLPLMKYYLSAGGVYLGSVLLWYMSLAPVLLREARSWRFYLLIFLLPLPFVRTGVLPPPYDLKIALVQTNVPEEVKLSRDLFRKETGRLLRLVEEAARKNPDLIILPESAFPFFAGDLHEEGARLLEVSRRVPLVVGLVDVRVRGEEVEPYNSVFALKGGDVVDFYDKVRLLPFGEYVPFPFGFVKGIFGAIGGIDYRRGEDLDCLDLNGLKVATPVCFEVSYYTLVRRISRCAHLIAVLTNDGWFRDSDGTFQHMRQARVRAVETRRYLLWVNNTGPSGVISPEGEVLAQIPYGREGILVYRIRSRP